MASSITDATIEHTPKGVKCKLDALYLYPDGHANITFADGTNVPCELHFDVMIQLATLLRLMQGELNKKPKGGN